MGDAASRFRDKYISKTTSYNVPGSARRWYVRPAEVFIKAHSGRRLATLTADDIENYLKEKGRSRSEKLTDWQFRQMVDALRILFTGLVVPRPGSRSSVIVPIRWLYSRTSVVPVVGDVRSEPDPRGCGLCVPCKA